MSWIKTKLALCGFALFVFFSTASVTAGAADFLFISTDQAFDTLDCDKKGFDGVIIANAIQVSPKSGKSIQILCRIVRFEPGSKITATEDITISARTRLEGPAEIIANAAPAIRRVSITRPFPAAAEHGEDGAVGRNLRGPTICTAQFNKASDAGKMNGEHGEDADHGLPGPDGLPGSNGNAGKSVTVSIGGFRADTRLRIVSRGSDGLSGEDGRRGQNGGKGGNGGRGANARPPLPCRSADNGGNGGDGGHGGNAGRGGNGGIGGNGGRGGSIAIYIRTQQAPPKQFLVMENLGGEGGAGGKGDEAGDPGKGGKGGARGDGGLAFLVRPAGANGRSGSDGVDGQSAPHGFGGSSGRRGLWGNAEVVVVE